MLSWGLCVSTYNRRDILVQCVGFALAQTRLPSEIVVVDSSNDWTKTRDAVAALLPKDERIAFRYLHSETKSLTVQRNIGIRNATANILFMIDDDSFLHEDFAEQIMRVYDRDATGAVAGVCGRNTPEHPRGLSLAGSQKDSGVRGAGSIHDLVLSTALGRWFNRKILFQSMDELFVKYDGDRQRPPPADLDLSNLRPISFLPGYSITVRRTVAEREPFDPALRYYASFEDLDATYRWSKHGVLLQNPQARLHHYEAAGGRLKRKTAIIFQLFNMLVFIKRHAPEPGRLLTRYRIMLWRRLLGEALKDGLSRRWSFPQVAGVLYAMRNWRRLQSVPAEELDEAYPRLQQRIREELG